MDMRHAIVSQRPVSCVVYAGYNNSNRYMAASMDVAAKREEQQARYERLSHAPSDGPDPGTSRQEAMKLIHSKILDYKHEHIATLRKIVELLLKLCQNICDHPEEPKYRKVRRLVVITLRITAFLYVIRQQQCLQKKKLKGTTDKPDGMQIRSRNAAFASTIAPNTNAVKLMSLCGWHAVTEDLEKTWVFDHNSDSPQFRSCHPAL